MNENLTCVQIAKIKKDNRYFLIISFFATLFANNNIEKTRLVDAI